MQAHSPHFLLYSEASATGGGRPRWKFVLQAIGGDDRFSAADTEPATRASRLELLAVVRGLEALDQPSRVTLLTHSRYVARGIRRGLSQWRERRWRWERFGKLVPIRDHDLWRRVDRALEFHQVECCAWETEDSAPNCPALAAGIPAAEAASPGLSEHALLVLPRPRAHGQTPGWSIGRALNRLRQGVLTPFSAIRRPAFTRAA